MAISIVRAGRAVTVWNRSLGKADELLVAGAREAESPARAAARADLVVSMVLDDAASRDVRTDADRRDVRGHVARRDRRRVLDRIAPVV